MNPTYEDRPCQTIMGITCRNTPDQIDYRAEWERFDKHLDVVRSLSVDDHYVAAYFMPEPEGETVDFVAGMLVEEGSQPPHDELVVRAIPAGGYAAFTCTMATISKTWGCIYREWQPPVGLQFDHTRPDLEIFSPKAFGPDAPVQILVPVETA